MPFFEKTVNEPTGQQVNETGGFGGVGRVGQVRQVGRVGREKMVEEVTTWFLGSCLGYSTFRHFENSKIRQFDNSWTCGAVGLWTFQIRGGPLFGWGDL